MSFDLSFHVHRLLEQYPFFSSFSRGIEKVANEKIPTAAISYNLESNIYCLLYNPAFMESLEDRHKIGILKHEFYHLILGHLSKRLPFDFKSQPDKVRIWNVAADLAINSYIEDELPKRYVKPDTGEPMTFVVPGRGRFKDYEPYGSAEMYYKKLLEDGRSEGLDSFDEHGWESGSGFQSMAAEEKLKDMLENSAKEASANGWGDTPDSIRRLIEKVLSHSISPETVLRYFIKTSVRSDRTSTVRKINRRYPYIHPGRRRKRVSNIAVSIDQSGSVTDEMLAIFYPFLNKFASLATFTVIPFDSCVSEELVYIWKKGETRDWERVKQGGTDFDVRLSG